MTYLWFCKEQGRFSHGKTALRSASETLVCGKEFMQGVLHIGKQVWECGLVDIPFWLITHLAPAHPLLSAWGTFFRLSLGWDRDWWYLGALQGEADYAPLHFPFCGEMLSFAAKLYQISMAQLSLCWELLPVTGSGICRLFWQSGSQHIFIRDRQWDRHTDSNVGEETLSHYPLMFGAWGPRIKVTNTRLTGEIDSIFHIHGDFTEKKGKPKKFIYISFGQSVINCGEVTR